jgi:hypothetical protein
LSRKAPSITFYLHERFLSPVTELVLRIGDAEARSSLLSLTNMVVGNDNPDASPFFPVGDFFRYFDELDRRSPLFDFSAGDLFQFVGGDIVLADSTGSAFTSLDLPHGLPLGAFDQRSGSVRIFDEEGERTGLLEFRIDSIRAIPEPSSLALLLTGLMASSLVGLRRAWLKRQPGAGDA